MAQIPLVSGGSQPVFAIDTLNGTQLSANVAYTPAGTPTNFAGPALEFYQIGNLVGIQNQAQVNGAVQQINQALQQFCTIAIEQVNTNSISVATYPVGAFGGNASVSATAVNAIVVGLGNIQITNGGVTTGFSTTGAATTNLGFKLSAT
jgi:hypothetical protein